MDQVTALNAVVYNELHRLPALIANCINWAAEIVIVDQSSTDGTWEWLKDYEHEMMLTVIRDKHWGYCEPSRKLAWKATRSEWIGVLDADERFSDEFILDIPRLVTENTYDSARLIRSLYVGGEHRFTGDTQYRFFKKDKVRFLDEIHTEPQPYGSPNFTYKPEYVGIWHEKSWVEQIRDEENYEQIITRNKNLPNRGEKLALNVHLKLLREHGITAEEADAMTINERIERGIGAYERTESS